MLYDNIWRLNFDNGQNDANDFLFRLLNKVKIEFESARQNPVEEMFVVPWLPSANAQSV